MDWENERYVRVYVRETIDDAVLSWEARALWDAIIKKFDRAGVIDMGSHGWRGLAVLIRMPFNIVSAAAEELLSDGRLELNGHTLVAPNFIVAQEAKSSDKQRKSESRARRRDLARAGCSVEKYGSIYLIQSSDGPVKLGFAVDVDSRLSNIRTSRPEGIKLIAKVDGKTIDDERELHKSLSEHRIKGEWYHPHGDVLSCLENVTACDILSDNVSKDVIPVTAGHNPSQSVTPSLAVPSLAKPSLAVLNSCPTSRSEVSLHEIESAYRRYPLKKGKAKGIASAVAAIKTRAEFERYRECIEHMATAFASDTTYCPHFSTFAAGKLWRDEDWPAPRGSPGPNRDVRIGNIQVTGNEKYQDGEIEL